MWDRLTTVYSVSLYIMLNHITIFQTDTVWLRPNELVLSRGVLCDRLSYNLYKQSDLLQMFVQPQQRG